MPVGRKCYIDKQKVKGIKMIRALLQLGQKGLSDKVILTFEPRPEVNETNPTAQLISSGLVRSAESWK